MGIDEMSIKLFALFFFFYAACAQIPETVPETDFAEIKPSAHPKINSGVISEKEASDVLEQITSKAKTKDHLQAGWGSRRRGEGSNGRSLKRSGPAPTYSIIAHRVNSRASMKKLTTYPGANSIEMDVAWVAKPRDQPKMYVPKKDQKRYAKYRKFFKNNLFAPRSYGGWYACHGDTLPGAKVPCNKIYGMQTAKSILEEMPQSVKMVWMDIKTGSTESQVHSDLWMSTQLVDTLLSIPRIARGEVAVILGYNSANKAYETIFHYLAIAVKGLNRQHKNLGWLIDVWASDKKGISEANAQCGAKKVRCSTSIGSSLIGQTGGIVGGVLSKWGGLGIWAKKQKNIYKTYFWTLPAGPAAKTMVVDDLIRLGAQSKNYWEYLVGHDWQCGSQFDGFIVGPFYNVFQGCGAGCRYMSKEMAKAGRSMAKTAEDFYVRYTDTAKPSIHCTCGKNKDMCDKIK